MLTISNKSTEGTKKVSLSFQKKNKDRFQLKHVNHHNITNYRKQLQYLVLLAG